MSSAFVIDEADTLLSHGSSSDTDESMDSAPSFPPFSPVSFNSATSNELDELESIPSVAMASPAPSVYSLTSSLRRQIFRKAYGREFNSYSEVYCLPADEEEIERLDTQHRMFQIMMGPWVLPLPEVLAPEPGVTKAVLDLGCGSGAWFMDVARSFPECSAVGVDLVPVQSTSMPPNCRSEVDDINLGLEHFYDSFDVTHARLIASVHAFFYPRQIKDYAALINHMARCLRPRGLIIVKEFDFRLYHPDKTVLAPWSTTRPSAEAPYLCRWFYAVGRAARMRGGHLDAPQLLHLWIRQHPCFAEEEIVYREVWCPCGPWEHKDEWGGVGKYPREIGEMMQDDLHLFLRGGRLLLLQSGLSSDEVDFLETNAHRELDESTIPMLFKIHCVYARKRAAP